jgi:hypothetical protein
MLPCMRLGLLGCWRHASAYTGAALLFSMPLLSLAEPHLGCSHLLLGLPTDYFWRWTHYLPWYGGASTQSIYNSPSSFQGCGGNAVEDLEWVEFVAPYNWGGDRWICLDRIALA